MDAAAECRCCGPNNLPSETSDNYMKVLSLKLSKSSFNHIVKNIYIRAFVIFDKSDMNIPRDPDLSNSKSLEAICRQSILIAAYLYFHYVIGIIHSLFARANVRNED